MISPLLILDGSHSPYLPPREILEAFAAGPLLEWSPTELATMLRQRLALVHGVTASRIALFPGDDRRLDWVLRIRPDRPLVWYPPSDFDCTEIDHTGSVIEIERTTHFRIEAKQIEATPTGATALITTPNDPTGNALGLTTAASLARRTGLLILDERSAEMQRRSMIPLVEEFDSIVLLRSFADWAGLGETAPAYAITTPAIGSLIDRSDEINEAGLRGALVAVRNAAKLDAIAHRVRLERMRLFRMLRKLNFLAPYPSDAGYVLASVTRGDRDQIARQLLASGISVHIPQDPRLAHTLRFAAISPIATQRLQHALVEISRTIPV